MKQDRNTLELMICKEEPNCSSMNHKFKPYDESAGEICFRYGVSGIIFMSVIGGIVRGIRSMFNQELIEEVKENLFSEWSDEGFKTFMQINHYIYAPIAVVGGLGFAYLTSKGVSKGIKKINEKIYGFNCWINDKK